MMKNGVFLICCAALPLSACNRSTQTQAQEPQLANGSATKASEENKAATSDKRTPLSEPNGAIDPTSVEAAGQVVQSYGALIEQQRWPEAAALWGSPGQAAKFRGDLAQLADVHLEIGNLGEPEGAAGSIYVTMPAIFYGDLKNGQPFRRSADITLRRVNDVPGSTDAQRRWHIERIDWAG
jgi:hypothetical protein